MSKDKNRLAIAALMAAALVCALAVGVVLPTNTAAQAPAPQHRMMRYRGTVVTANGAAIILRNPANPHEQVTFSYSPAVREEMVKVLTAGGFQYGDKLTVDYVDGTSVALKLHGKPSKPKKPKTPPPDSTPSSSPSPSSQ
ncbi:MAG TPA: hypothetical protein VLV89_12405 [Candidatus Acidoferrum sp.]|nr:hypothetical protein [Candidatus Acidoferrum sp.]